MFLQQDIEEWAEEKGIYKDASFIAQMKGIAEEAVEATEAFTVIEHMAIGEHSFKMEPLELELGDIYVWWINACAIAGINPEDAVTAAYQKITKRTGTMVDGRFVKDE